MFDYAALERRIAALEANRGASLRFGTVTESDPETGAARVQLEDGNGMVSYPLRVLQERTLKDKRQTMPDIGEPVAALFSGQGMEQGVVLGACYSSQTPPPAQPAAHDYMRYEDGTEIWYDRTAHKLIARVKGDAEIETEGQITAKAKKEICAESEVNITLKAPTITLAGLLRVTDKDGSPGSGELLGHYKILQGGLDVPDDDVTAGVVSLREHVHKGVQSGPSTTDTPVGG